MKPHIKVIQRNGVDIFVTSSMVMKEKSRPIATFTPTGSLLAMGSVSGLHSAGQHEQYRWASNYNRLMCDPYLKSQRDWSNLFADLG